MTTLKDLKRLLKKAGMKSSGSKRALTRRARKARLVGGQNEPNPDLDVAEQRERERARYEEASRRAGEVAEEVRRVSEEQGTRAVGRMAAEEAATEGQRRMEAREWARNRRPGGFRKTKKSVPKKMVTKKRPVRHLSASAYRW